MDEKKYQKILVFKLLVIVLCGFLYAWGGIEMKWLRRFLMPTIAVGTMFAFSKDWRCFCQLPVWTIGLCMGYGADEVWVKVLKRVKVAIICGIGSAGKIGFDAIRIEKKMWIVFAFQCSLLVSAYILFGVFNPFSYFNGGARIEETLLGMFQVTVPILSATKKEV